MQFESTQISSWFTFVVLVLTTKIFTIRCIRFSYRDFYAAVGDNSGVEPELICGAREPFDVLVQAKKVLLLSHAEREIHGDRIGFQLHYMTLNHSVSEGKVIRTKRSFTFHIIF